MLIILDTVKNIMRCVFISRRDSHDFLLHIYHRDQVGVLTPSLATEGSKSCGQLVFPAEKFARSHGNQFRPEVMLWLFLQSSFRVLRGSYRQSGHRFLSLYLSLSPIPSTFSSNPYLENRGYRHLWHDYKDRNPLPFRQIVRDR